jgi:hypothetical protein
MLPIIVLQVAILLGIVVLMLKKNPLGPILQKLAEGIVGLSSRSEHLEADVRSGIQDVRRDLTTGMGQSRDDASRFFDQVRRDSSELRELLTQRHDVLVENINVKLAAIGQTLLTQPVGPRSPRKHPAAHRGS